MSIHAISKGLRFVDYERTKRTKNNALKSREIRIFQSLGRNSAYTVNFLEKLSRVSKFKIGVWTQIKYKIGVSIKNF